MGDLDRKVWLSEHFSLEEMCYSRIAVENGIDNSPPEKEQRALKHLATDLLEPLRKLYGKPIAILSGYRSEKVNRLAGGVSSSQHLRGEAADCYTPDIKGLLAVLQRSGLVFDQAILYCKRNFLHLSLKATGKNRMQVLLFMLSLFLFLPGCGVRGQYVQQERAIQVDTATVSLLHERMEKKDFRLTDTTTWQLLQIAYAPPDSMGRQFPAVATSLRMDSHRLLTDTGQVQRREQMQADRSETKIVTGKKELLPARQRSRWWFWVGLILVVGLSVFERLRKHQ